jgi:hypothetical protein
LYSKRILPIQHFELLLAECWNLLKRKNRKYFLISYLLNIRRENLFGAFLQLLHIGKIAVVRNTEEE